MSVCYIIAAGDCNSIVIDKKIGDLIIAADKGLEHCRKFSVLPDIVVGDFDSLGFVPDHENVISLPVEKDDTDTSFAIKYAMDKGYRKFVIFGGLGGRRSDHTFANIAMLSFISKNGGNGVLAGDGFCITSVTDGSISFDESLQGDISVFSFDEKADGVTESGLKYELYNATLYNSAPLGVSNSFTGQKSCVEVNKGTLIIYFKGKFSDFSIDK